MGYVLLLMAGYWYGILGEALGYGHDFCLEERGKLSRFHAQCTNKGKTDSIDQVDIWMFHKQLFKALCTSIDS